MAEPTPSAAAPVAAVPTEDGRQSAAALAIRRGAQRCLLAHGLSSLPEFTLANARRADLIAVAASGDIWIIEIKSSLADFRADQKWPDYRDFCDRFLFAVAPDFPLDVLPDDAGLILADRFSGEIVRPAPEHRLSAARRKTLLVQIARQGAWRLAALGDPDIAASMIDFG